MSRPSVLLVDGDEKSLRVLQASLKNAGFAVRVADSGDKGLKEAEGDCPSVVVVDTETIDSDSFHFCEEFKSKAQWALIPLLVLSSDTESLHEFVGLELGVDDCLTKPVYINELTARIRLLLQRSAQATFERQQAGDTFVSSLETMSVVDLIQSIEVVRKTGVIHLESEGRRGSFFFRDGSIVDGEVGPLMGQDALYRLLTWSTGSIEARFQPVRRKAAIELSTPELLTKGMSHLAQWQDTLEALPSLSGRFELVYGELWERLGDLPDEVNHVLRLFDGNRSLVAILDASPLGDLPTAEILARLYSEGLIAPPDLRDVISNDLRPLSVVGVNNDRKVFREPLPEPATTTGSGLIAQAIAEAMPVVPQVTTSKRATQKGMAAVQTPAPDLGETGSGDDNVVSGQIERSDEEALSALFMASAPPVTVASIIGGSKEAAKEPKKESPPNALAQDASNIIDSIPNPALKAEPEEKSAEHSQSQRPVSRVPVSPRRVETAEIFRPPEAKEKTAKVSPAKTPSRIPLLLGLGTVLGAVSLWVLRMPTSEVSHDPKPSVSQTSSQVLPSQVVLPSQAFSTVTPPDAGVANRVIADASVQVQFGSHDAAKKGAAQDASLMVVSVDASFVPIPKDSQATAREQSKSIERRARRALRKGSRLDALALIDDAISLYPNSSAKLFKGELLLSIGDAKAALVLAEGLTRRSPTWAPGFRLLGLALVPTDKSRAKAALQRYLSLAPSAKDASKIRETINRMQ